MFRQLEKGWRGETGNVFEMWLNIVFIEEGLTEDDAKVTYMWKNSGAINAQGEVMVGFV